MSRASPTALRAAGATAPSASLGQAPPGQATAPGGERVVVERPPGTVARGIFPVSQALVIALGAALVLLTAFFVIRQVRRR